MNTTPQWFRKSSVYQINPRTFSREGTIASVTEELTRISELGFKVIYLCPVFREDDNCDPEFLSPRQKASGTGNPKNPYRMNDYFEIDSEYGTMDDLRVLVRTAHTLGMRVLLDLVYLHIGPRAEILAIHPEFAAKNPDGTVKLTRWNFPYLNYECEGLREYLYCNMTYYVGVIDADGFRCDVGDGVPLDFWREGKRRICAIKPEAVMINEGEKPEYLTVFDANYSFLWHETVFSLLKGDIGVSDAIAVHESILKAAPADSLILRDMENHDTVTDWPYRLEAHYGSGAMEMLLAMSFSLDGIPMVYSGNELADTARVSMFANRFYPGSFEFTDRERSGTEVDRRKEIMKRLNAFRLGTPVFTEGQTVWNTVNNRVMSFDRVTCEDRIRYVGNFSDSCQELSLSENAVPLLSRGAECNGETLTLSPFGYVILKLADK